MTSSASKLSNELGKLEGMTFNDKIALNKTIGLGALKYHILKVDPKKRILFDPNDSIDFNGNTGPFIQYTYARIQSLITKSNFKKTEFAAITLICCPIILLHKEKKISFLEVSIVSDGELYWVITFLIILSFFDKYFLAVFQYIGFLVMSNV